MVVGILAVHLFGREWWYGVPVWKGIVVHMVVRFSLFGKGMVVHMVVRFSLFGREWWYICFFAITIIIISGVEMRVLWQLQFCGARIPRDAHRGGDHLSPGPSPTPRQRDGRRRWLWWCRQHQPHLLHRRVGKHGCNCGGVWERGRGGFLSLCTA